MRRRAALAAALAALAALLTSPRVATAAAAERYLPVALPADESGAAETYRVRALVAAGDAARRGSGGSGGAHAPVLLLHGASFNADTWDALGTLKLLSAAGYDVAALDLPGASGGGTTPDARVALPRRGALLLGALDALAWRGPVHVVAPSASGRFALPLLLRAPQRIASFVPVAAVGLEGAVAQLLAASEPARAGPTLLIWGEKCARTAVARPGSERLR